MTIRAEELTRGQHDEAVIISPRSRRCNVARQDNVS
jgi:hypothetical protein